MPHVVYSKAPISEAVVEIRYKTHVDKNASLSHIQALSNRIKADYPKNEELVDISAQVGPGVLTHSQHASGRQLQSKDKSRWLRLSQNRYTFLQVGQYKDWNFFIEHARRHWGEYRKIQAAEPIRVGLRFINRIDVPMSEDPKQYLNIGPSMPNTSIGVNAFLLQVQTKVEGDIGATITVANTVTDNKADSTTLLLDIDTFVETGLTKDEAIIWELLEQMRTVKNKLFEACITETLRTRII